MKKMLASKSVVQSAVAPSKKTPTLKSVPTVEHYPSSPPNQNAQVAIRRNDKVFVEILGRYKAINALHIAYYNRLSDSPAELAHEFFYAVGDILEGKPLNTLATRLVDVGRVQEFLDEDRDNDK